MGSATAGEREKNIEFGAATAIFALAILLGWLCLPKETKHPGNVRLTVTLLLSFATFLCGNALLLVNFSMMSLRENLISNGQRAASKCLRPACHVMMVLTLLSLLALLPGGVYLYIGLGFVTVIVPVAGGVHWYLRCHGGGEAADEEHNKKLYDASKITSCVTYSAFGGIVGVLFNASKVSAQAASTAAYSAIFFMFSTAILGMFVMTVSKKVPEIRSPPCRRLFITGVRLANAFLLCTLASAALAASFTVLRHRIFAAFVPLVVTATISLLLRHCVPRRRRSHAAGGSGHEEAGIKAMEDIASKVMVATLGGIMSVLGGWLGEKDRGKWAAMDVFMVVLTSAFVSSFGFTVLVAAPGSARERLAPVARVLIWSTVALFAATAVAVYGMEAWVM